MDSYRPSLLLLGVERKLHTIKLHCKLFHFCQEPLRLEGISGITFHFLTQSISFLRGPRGNPISCRSFSEQSVWNGLIGIRKVKWRIGMWCFKMCGLCFRRENWPKTPYPLVLSAEHWGALPSHGSSAPPPDSQRNCSPCQCECPPGAVQTTTTLIWIDHTYILWNL